LKRLYYLSVIERPLSAKKVIYCDYVDTTVLDREGCGHGVAGGNIAKDIRIPENFHSDERVRVEGPKFCTPFPSSVTCSTRHILLDAITLNICGTFLIYRYILFHLSTNCLRTRKAVHRI
jgi:hypothetical protein